MCSYAVDEDVTDIFDNVLNNCKLDIKEIEKYKTSMLVFLANEYSKKDWTMQIHYGSMRNVNAKMFKHLGPDTGYDCISTNDSSAGLASLLNEIENNSNMPKTIVYSLNPNDDAMICSVIGCFQGQGIKGRIQHGSAWWFNDTKAGMIKQIENLASFTALGNFVGMLTDSRSFLSYARHEYFRRILCNVIGSIVDNGEYPYDAGQLQELVENISYYNSKEYFGF